MKGALLLNLGSPDSTEVGDVKNYLEEFLMDERVLDVSKAYSKVWTDEGSPLIVTSKKQKDLVQDKTEIPVFLGMRYGNPSTASIIEEINKAGVTELLIVPLYPHYAMSSYESAYVKTMAEIAEQAPHIKTKLVQPYYKDPKYINALWESIRPKYEGSGAHLMMSFHGIPERHVKKSDPSHAHCLVTPDCCDTCHPAHATCYRHQCVTTAKELMKHGGIDEKDVTILPSIRHRLLRDSRRNCNGRKRRVPGAWW